MRILLIDDDVASVNMIARFLRNTLGHDVTVENKSEKYRK